MTCCSFFFFNDTATTEIYTTTDTLSLHDALPISAGPVGGPPAIANLEVREAETQTPGGRPLAPSLCEVPLSDLDVVVLDQAVVDGLNHDAELQAQRLPQTGQRHLATHPHPEQPVREAEAVFDGLAAHRNRVACGRDDRRGRIGPGVAPDRLIDRVD